MDRAPVRRGAVNRRDDVLELADCTIGKFHVTGYQGGSCDVDFRIQCSDVDATAIGATGAMLHEQPRMTLTHTEVQPNAAAPAAPTESPAPAKDATELFAES